MRKIPDVSRQLRTTGLVTAMLAGVALPAMAQDEPVLTIDGLVRDGQSFKFTLEELQAMPTGIVRTGTPWHEQVVEFEGVALSHLMELVGAAGETAFVVALNEYTAEVPVADFAEFEPILAFAQDGELLTVADKGPLFIIYPYDSDTRLQAEKYYLRSVWSVASITVE